MSSRATVSTRAALPDGEALKRGLTELLNAARGAGAALHVIVAAEQLNISIGTLSIGGEVPLSENARFGVACMVRFLASLVAMKLAEQGRIDLDASIGSYLPELRTAGGSKGAGISVRHLLTHTAGYKGLDIADGPPNWQWEDCVKFLEETPQFFAPGKVFSEEHLDHAILGRILLCATGSSATELIREHIFDPLGIRVGNTATDPPELRVYGHRFSIEKQAFENGKYSEQEAEIWAPSLSNMTLTAADMARIGEALTRDGCSAFSALIARQARNPVVELPRAACARQNSNWLASAFTLCCARFSTGLFGYFASGRGQCSAIVLDAERQISVGLGLNVPMPLLRDRILNLVFDHLLGPNDGRFERRAASEPEPRDFHEFIAPLRASDLVGRYVGSKRDEVVVGVRAGRLRISLGKQLAVTLGVLQRNRLMIDSRAPVPVAVFAEPQSGRPCIMLGMSVFMKMP